MTGSANLTRILAALPGQGDVPQPGPASPMPLPPPYEGRHRAPEETA